MSAGTHGAWAAHLVVRGDGSGTCTLLRPLLVACLVNCRLVCTGSLTNAAMLVTLYPEVLPMVDVTIMGGAMGEGNTVRGLQAAV